MDTHEEDGDIYSDLPNFEYHETLEKLQAKNKSLQTKVAELEELVVKLTKENSEYEKNYSQLKTNASTLFKTAQSEIKRKDKRILELNREIITFKTRSQRVKHKRNLPDSFNDNNDKRAKRIKVTDSNEIHAKEAIKTAVTDRPDNSLNNSFNSPSSKVDNGTSSQTAPVVRVPNINCPTLYSQRMFKKIYNVEPVNRSIFDSETSSSVVDRSPSPCEGTQSKVESPVNKNNTVHLPDNEINRKIQSSENSEANNNVKLTTVCKEKEPSSTPIILDSGGNTKKDDIKTLSITDIPCNLHELSKDIHVKELRSIISNVMSFDTTKQLQTPQSNLEGKPKGATIASSQVKEAVTSNDNSKTPLRKTEINSGNVISEPFGLKLSNRQSKTAFCPISGQWNGVLQKKEVGLETKASQAYSSPPHEKNDVKSDMMEALFGSPLKWAENSADSEHHITKLTPPITAYEDSCSAQIENSKFKKLHNVQSVANMKPLKEIALNKVSHLIEKPKTSLSLEKPSIQLGIQKLEEFSSRPFEQIRESRSEIASFSAFVDLGKGVKVDSTVPYLSITLDQTSRSTKLVQSSRSYPKYNDSILGQFDDTTQLISALARDHSKISPIHTPVKDTKIETVSSPDTKSHTKTESSSKTSGSNVTLLNQHAALTKKSEKKTILLDKPINILRPRKTPRIIHDKKTTSSKQDTQTTSSVSNIKNELAERTTKESKESSLTMTNSSRLITPCSSVSNEVIKRVRAVGRSVNYRKCKYEDYKYKYKTKESVGTKERVQDSTPKEKVDLRNKFRTDEVDNSQLRIEERCPNDFRRNHSSSNRKENSPGNYRREERSRSDCHFKRPLSYYSRHRKNCRFRHSSVERKLIRDHRHSNRVRSTPVRVIKKHDLDNCFKPSESMERKSEPNPNQSLGLISSPEVGSSKGTKFCEKIDSSYKKTPTTQSKFVSPLRMNSPFSTPTPKDTSLQRTTHIRRSSAKIEWSASTSDVVSTTQSAENTPLTPRTESRMKWFLQPIDFGVSSPRVSPKSGSICNKSISENASVSGDCEQNKIPKQCEQNKIPKQCEQNKIPKQCEQNKIPKQSHDSGAITNECTQGKSKSPNIVVVRRKRPVKLGVSEISVPVLSKSQ